MARPVGSFLFGHFGDRLGRKSTLVSSLLLMGGSTVLIGCLPGYASAGWAAPALLSLLRMGQGAGLGGESGLPRQEALGLLCATIVVMAAVAPVSARLADRFGARTVVLAGTASAAASGFTVAPLLGAGTAAGTGTFMALELALMGAVFAPMGALLPGSFPTAVRCTGASAAYNLDGVLGASLAPYAAQQLLEGGLAAVGLCITGTVAVSIAALLMLPPAAGGGLAER